jgi:hypothetical protein
MQNPKSLSRHCYKSEKILIPDFTIDGENSLSNVSRSMRKRAYLHFLFLVGYNWRQARKMCRKDFG